MPNSNSAKKRLRQNIKRTIANRAQRSAMKTQVRKTREAIAGGSLETSRTELTATIKKLDRAAARGIIHANAAARTKSRLNKAVKALAGK